MKPASFSCHPEFNSVSMMFNTIIDSDIPATITPQISI